MLPREPVPPLTLLDLLIHDWSQLTVVGSEVAFIVLFIFGIIHMHQRHIMVRWIDVRRTGEA